MLVSAASQAESDEERILILKTRDTMLAATPLDRVSSAFSLLRRCNLQKRSGKDSNQLQPSADGYLEAV